MILVDDALVREVSSCLFGGALRLPLLIWLRQERDEFYIKEAAGSLGAEQQSVGATLRRFAALGLVERVPTFPKDRRKFDRVNQSNPIWAVVEAIELALRDRDHLPDADSIARDLGELPRP